MSASASDLHYLRRRHSQLSSLDQLKALHWDSAERMFLDWGSHTEDVELLPAANGEVTSLFMHGNRQRCVLTKCSNLDRVSCSHCAQLQCANHGATHDFLPDVSSICSAATRTLGPRIIKPF